MYPRIAFPLRTLFFLFFSYCGNSQTYYGQHEIGISYGILTLQHNMRTGFESGLGVSGEHVADQTAMGMITYRYYIGGCTSVGLTAGINKFSTSGDYGNRMHLDYYKYTFTTIASEFTFNYKNSKYFRGYGYFGAGISFFKEERKRYNSVIQDYEMHTIQRSGFNGQFVPFGISVGGNLSAFLEVGFGYKGAIHGGISYRFDSRKHNSHAIHSDIKKATIIYGKYNVDSNWVYLGKLRSSRPKRDRDFSLEHQLDRLAIDAAKSNANAVIIKRILNWHCNGCFWLKGEAWIIPNPDSFKVAVEKKNEKNTIDKNYAYIIVYRAERNATFKNKKGYLKIDSSEKFEIVNNVKYIFKISDEGCHNIYIPGFITKRFHIDVKKGHKYYFNGQVQKRLDLKKMKDGAGEIESNNGTTTYHIELK